MEETTIDKAIQIMIPIIERDGACSIGSVLKDMQIHHNEYHPPTKLMYKIIGKMCADGKYKPLLVNTSDDCFIQLNPEYAYYQSVKETNESVRVANATMEGNIRLQNKLNKCTILVAAISTLFIILNTIILFYSPTSKDMNTIDKSLKYNRNTIDSIASTLIEKGYFKVAQKITDTTHESKKGK